MMRLFPVLAMLCACGNAARIARPAAGIPLELTDTQQIVVEASLYGGTPRPFLVDTGATVSVITPALRSELGFLAGDGTITEVRSAGGVMERVRAIDVERLTLGGQEEHHVRFLVMDLSHVARVLGRPVAGILGKNLLARAPFVLDLPRHSLRFGDLDGDDLITMRFREAGNGLIRIEGALENKRGLAVIVDVGAGRSMLGEEALAWAGLRPRDLRFDPIEVLIGAHRRPPIVVRRHFFGELSLGKARFDAPELAIGPLPILSELGMAQTPAMILGTDLLRDRVVVVDWPHRILKISRRPAGVALLAGAMGPDGLCLTKRCLR